MSCGGLAFASIALIAGCSISSTPSNVDQMRCVHAHDYYDGSGVPVRVCDQYLPTPLPTVTVTVTPQETP